MREKLFFRTRRERALFDRLFLERISFAFALKIPAARKYGLMKRKSLQYSWNSESKSMGMIFAMEFAVDCLDLPEKFTIQRFSNNPSTVRVRFI